MPTILVTGGAGYIGSHTIVDLLQHGYDVISVDNFSRSTEHVFDAIAKLSGKRIKNYNIDLTNFNATREIFLKEKNIDGIIHFAAYKSVNESIAFPMMYYENNMYSLFNILKLIEEFSVKAFVFSSSCSVYGNVNKLPVTENTSFPKPECPYAATKQMGEQVIQDFCNVNAMPTILLRYFNPVGAHTAGFIGEVPIGKPSNLVPAITQTAAGLQEKLFVWGNDYDTRDGSCIRDFIHVMDIAEAHSLALDYLLQKKNSQTCEVFNAGSGNGVSVLEAINAFEKVNGVKLNYEIGPRREGDVVSIYANNNLIAEKLGWKAKYDINEMMRTAWQWQLNLMKG